MGLIGREIIWPAVRAGGASLMSREDANPGAAGRRARVRHAGRAAVFSLGVSGCGTGEGRAGGRGCCSVYLES